MQVATRALVIDPALRHLGKVGIDMSTASPESSPTGRQPTRSRAGLRTHQRNGRDSNPRALRPSAFKADAFVRSATVPADTLSVLPGAHRSATPAAIAPPPCHTQNSQMVRPHRRLPRPPRPELQTSIERATDSGSEQRGGDGSSRRAASERGAPVGSGGGQPARADLTRAAIVAPSAPVPARTRTALTTRPIAFMPVAPAAAAAATSSVTSAATSSSLSAAGR